MPLAQQTSASQTPHISPAELSYLYTSLSSPSGPIRPDGRSPTQFRFLTAETGILPGTNGSARIGFADGSEAIVGVKAELERTLATDALDLRQLQELERGIDYADEDGGDGGGGGGSNGEGSRATPGQGSWVQMSIEIPGFRDDDALPVFLSEMMRESLVGSNAGGSEEDKMVGGLKGRLVINRRWHWRLYIDVLLLSPPQSYPLPLLSLTTHLALLSTRLPKLKSQGEEDPFFEDDWNLSEYIYPRPTGTTQKQTQRQARPPVTLLVISTGQNVIFDPTREEIAVADAVLAVSIGREQDVENTDANLKLLSIRTIDPPSRLTQHGVPDSENAATLAALAAGPTAAAGPRAETAFAGTDEEVPGVWKPRRGGVSRSVISKIVKMVLAKGGVGDEVMEGLEGVEEDDKMKGTVTSNIPRFLLPRGIQSRTLQYFHRRNFSSTTWRQATTAEDKPRTLLQPDKFRPPSHPARRVVQTRNGNKVVREPFNYPGRPLTAQEKEEQKTKRYPNMFPAEGTVLFKFLTSRWIHVWIAMGVLTSLATFTFTENFKRTSQFAHLLPPWSGLLTSPIDTISQAISVWKMHVQHTSMVARENRHKRVEDAEKRRQYRIAHGLEEPSKVASPIVEDDQSPIAPPMAAAAETAAVAPEGAAQVAVVEGGEKRAPKRWLGIW